MKVQVVVALAGIRADVCHDSVAADEAFFPRNAPKRPKDSAQQRRIGPAQLVGGGNMPARDGQTCAGA